MLHEIIHVLQDTFTGFKKSGFALEARGPAVEAMDLPATLCLPLPTSGAAAAVSHGDAIAPGQPLWKRAGVGIGPSPVAGTAGDVIIIPDLRASKSTTAVLVKVAEVAGGAPFEAMDPGAAEPASILKRLDQAGVTTDDGRPIALSEALRGASCVIVLAADREPGVSSAAAVVAERPADVARAARMLGRAVGVGAKVAVLAGGPTISGVDAITLPARYPESLDPLVALAAGGKGVVVVGVQAALAALDAVAVGKVQDSRVITVIDAHRRPVANLRVPLGTRLGEVVTRAGLEPQTGDKLVAGGPMRGLAQYSGDVALDAGVTAIVHVAAADIVESGDDPCVMCGKCVEVCPIRLQVQLIGRFAEFGRFERAGDYELEQCIKCGLCASVCTARRPLVQLIELAMKQLDATRPAAVAQPDEAAAERGAK